MASASNNKRTHNNNNISNNRVYECQSQDCCRSVPTKKLKTNNNNNNNMQQIITVDAKKKTRVRWNQTLHGKFMEAVVKLGGLEKATPLNILNLMNDPGISRDHVASHLQKLRKSSSFQNHRKIKKQITSNHNNNNNNNNNNGYYYNTNTNTNNYNTNSISGGSASSGISIANNGGNVVDASCQHQQQSAVNYFGDFSGVVVPNYHTTTSTTTTTPGIVINEEVRQAAGFNDYSSQMINNMSFNHPGIINHQFPQQQQQQQWLSGDFFDSGGMEVNELFDPIYDQDFPDIIDWGFSTEDIQRVLLEFGI